VCAPVTTKSSKGVQYTCRITVLLYSRTSDPIKVCIQKVNWAKQSVCTSNNNSTGEHRQDNSTTVQLYNWSEQSIFLTSLSITRSRALGLSGVQKVCVFFVFFYTNWFFQNMIFKVNWLYKDPWDPESSKNSICLWMIMEHKIICLPNLQVACFEPLNANLVKSLYIEFFLLSVSAT
jgi:hypothetical protein